MNKKNTRHTLKNPRGYDSAMFSRAALSVACSFASSVYLPTPERVIAAANSASQYAPVFTLSAKGPCIQRYQSLMILNSCWNLS